MISATTAAPRRRNRDGPELSKISRGRCVIAVPIFDGSILGLQKPEQTAVGAVPEMMAPRFDGVARFEEVGRDSNPLEPSATGGFESPHLRLAFVVLDFQVDSGMRDDQVHFLDHTLHIHERVDVVAVGMVRPRGQREGNGTSRHETKT